MNLIGSVPVEIGRRQGIRESQIRVMTQCNSEAFGDIKLLVIPYEYLVGNIAKVSS